MSLTAAEVSHALEVLIRACEESTIDGQLPDHLLQRLAQAASSTTHNHHHHHNHDYDDDDDDDDDNNTTKLALLQIIPIALAVLPKCTELPANLPIGLLQRVMRLERPRTDFQLLFRQPVLLYDQEFDHMEPHLVELARRVNSWGGEGENGEEAASTSLARVTLDAVRFYSSWLAPGFSSRLLSSQSLAQAFILLPVTAPIDASSSLDTKLLVERVRYLKLLSYSPAFAEFVRHTPWIQLQDLCFGSQFAALTRTRAAAEDDCDDDDEDDGGGKFAALVDYLQFLLNVCKADSMGIELLRRNAARTQECIMASLAPTAATTAADEVQVQEEDDADHELARVVALVLHCTLFGTEQTNLQFLGCAREISTIVSVVQRRFSMPPALGGDGDDDDDNLDVTLGYKLGDVMHTVLLILRSKPLHRMQQLAGVLLKGDWIARVLDLTFPNEDNEDSNNNENKDNGGLLRKTVLEICLLLGCQSAKRKDVYASLRNAGVVAKLKSAHDRNSNGVDSVSAAAIAEILTWAPHDVSNLQGSVDALFQVTQCDRELCALVLAKKSLPVAIQEFFSAKQAYPSSTAFQQLLWVLNGELGPPPANGGGAKRHKPA